MERRVNVMRYALPLLLAGIGAALKIQAGQLDLPLLLVIAIGGLLGWAAAVALESVAVLTGGLPVSTTLSDRALVQLRRDKEMALRSIKDVELDAALGKVEPDEAQLLTEPLRERAMTLLRELDQAQAKGTSTIDEQIEAELARRLGGAGEPAATSEEPRPATGSPEPREEVVR